LHKATGVRIQRPLAKATMRRLAKGTFKFVLNAGEPFIVSLTHQGGGAAFMTEHANGSTKRSFSLDEPMRTQCAEIKGGHFALVSAFLAKHYGGNETPGSDMRRPIDTITARDHNALAVSFMSKFYGTNVGQRTNEPLHSVTAQGGHLAHVLGFLMKYYGEGGQLQDLREPMHTIPTKDRMGLVTLHGELWRLVDICMRMLVPRELYRGQGFPESYIIEIEIEKMVRGKLRRVKLSQEAQVRMCGNSVCPPLAEALVRANVPEMIVWERREKRRYDRVQEQRQLAA
jgi:DNA (cytosine-5)-methyltransferase 1